MISRRRGLVESSIVSSVVAVAAMALHPTTAFSPDRKVSWLVAISTALGFALAERYPARTSVRGVALAFTPNDLPLVLGFWFLPFPALIAAFVFGSLPSYLVRFRRSPDVAIANVLLIILQVELFTLVANSARDGAGPNRPIAWVAVAIGVAAKELATYGLIHLNLYRQGRRTTLRTTAINGSWAVIAAALVGEAGMLTAMAITVDPLGPILVACIALPLVTTLRSQVSLASTADRLRRLQNVTAALAATRSSANELPAVLAVAADALETRQLLVDLNREPVGPHERRLLSGAGTGLGTLVAVETESTDSLDASDRALLFDNIASQLSQWMENARLEDELILERERRVFAETHDANTQLPNRQHFIDQMKKFWVEQPGEPMSIILVVLDDFTDVVELIGRGGADKVLRAVSDRLAEVLPYRAILAKLTGDEFGVCIQGTADETRISNLSDAIVATLREEFNLADYDDVGLVGGLSMPMVPRVGWALLPEDANDIGLAMERINSATSLASGTKTWIQRASNITDEAELRRRFIHADLRRGIRDGELLLHFQPKLDLRNGRVVGTEALVRWDHPRFGLVMPNDFIPYAEENGLIGPLSLAVLEMAVAQLAVWQSGVLQGLSLAVNIDPASISDTDVLATMTELCLAQGLPLTLLVLELTERSVVQDEKTARALLEKVVALGVRISIDDFGSGVNQLEYIQQLPIHELKIDRSIIRHLSEADADDALVRGIIELSRRKGLTVVAEGVEDLFSLDRLRAMGCDVAQGYIIARPMPGNDLEAWVTGKAVNFQTRLSHVA